MANFLCLSLSLSFSRSLSLPPSLPPPPLLPLSLLPSSPSSQANLLSSEMASAQQLLEALDARVATQWQLEMGGLILEASCLTDLDTQTYLSCSGVTGTTGGLRIDDGGNGGVSTAAFATVLTFFILALCLIVVLVVVLLLFMVYLKRNHKM